MRIAVDAMGGDFAPAEVVAGAVRAARELPSLTKVFLVGDKAAVEKELAKHGSIPPLIEVRHASENIGMGESPAVAVRRKKDCSINRAMDLVKAGEADAVMSAGHTGAVVVSATLKLRTLEGVTRPAIAAVMPTSGRPCVVIDVGANIDSDARLLLEFGTMGAVYSKVIMGQVNPVVGLMSIGGEDTKGNETTKEAFRLLDASPLNFRGNVEGHDLFEGCTDVAVCDGFVGNVVLKTAESAARAIGQWMKHEFKRGPVRMTGALLLTGALKAMKRKLDPDMYGGAPLLGVNGTCIITHGASKENAIFHAVRVASESVHQHLNSAIVEEIRKLGEVK
ncbi:MAG: phosphate acyltransferase PlsX [Lentisphaerae bacterium]|nr:phosphate acyltransferase PlsX [Lentisphaerota bacterium]